MKKNIVFLFSVLIFQIHGKYHTNSIESSNFLHNPITKTDILNAIKPFITYTKTQEQKLYMLKKARQWFGKIPLVGTFIENEVEKEAIRRGYDEFSQRLINVGMLFFQQKNWEQKITLLLTNISEENLSYINHVKNIITSELQNYWQTKYGLNAMIRILHSHHIEALNKFMHFTKTELSLLLENQMLNNHQTYFQNFLLQLKTELPPYIILNMLITYLFSIHNLIIETTNI